MPALVVKDGPSAGRRIEVGAETELGRVGTDFLQEDAEASRRHAAVRTGPNGLEVEDLGSSNGTWVNDERITGTRTLAHGDRIRIGQTTLEVELDAPDRGTVLSAGPAQATQVGPRPQPSVPAEPAAEQPAAPPPSVPAETTAPIQPSAPPPGQPQPAQAWSAPETPFGASPPAQTPTAPQPPVAAGAPAYAQPYGGPAAGARPGVVTAAAILLFIVSFVSAAYAMFALLNNLELLLEVFDIAPFAFNAFYVLLVPAALLAVLQVIAAARLMSMKGRGLGIVSTALALAAWGGALLALVIVGGALLDYVVIVVVLALDVAIVALLGAAGRHFVRRA